jgi:hypothetical protein
MNPRKNRWASGGSGHGPDSDLTSVQYISGKTCNCDGITRLGGLLMVWFVRNYIQHITVVIHKFDEVLCGRA